MLPALSAAVTAVGVLWALSPLLVGDRPRRDPRPHPPADLPRALPHPPRLVPPGQPPGARLSGQAPGGARRVRGPRGPPVRAGRSCFLLGLLAFVFMLAATQTVGLVLHALSRNRRFHDRALVLGIGLGFLMSLLPFLFLYGGRSFREAAKAILARDVFALSPWAWPVRGAVHASRGEIAAHAALRPARSPDPGRRCWD